MIGAAIELFGTLGWAATTVAAIAERAGVAVETVYKSGGAKAALLRAAMDAAVVGDTQPIALADRPEYQKAIGEGEVQARIAQSAAITAAIHERSAGLHGSPITEAAASDPKIDEWRRELERGRRVEVARSAATMTGQSFDDHAVNMLWVHYGPDTYLKLVRDEGMSRKRYEAFLVKAATLLASIT